MQRRKGFAGLAASAAAVAVLTTGCSAGSGSGGGSDAKGGAGSTSPAPAPPGKYRSLPSPCKAVDLKRLKALLPVADSLTPEQRDQLYAGAADTSYDGDRRVGCRWNAQMPDTTRLLYVGFERVVSYDRSAASDDDKARAVYARQLTDAHIPIPVPAPSPTSPASSPSPGASASPASSASPA
ncbi:hypothetical protein EF918_32110, partial [Streptomyces sp. WAC06614]